MHDTHPMPSYPRAAIAATWNTLFCSLIFWYFSSSGCKWMLSRYLGRGKRESHPGDHLTSQFLHSGSHTARVSLVPKA